MGTKEQSWAAWADLKVGDAATQAAFCETLAKRQGWTVAFAEHVFHEYRKFLYLALTSTCPVTAPPPIRAVWDLHRELPSWRTLPEAGEIERRPSRGGSLEETHTAYTLAFGQYPPESIWPNRPRSPARARPPAVRRIAMALLACAVTALLALALPLALVLPAALGLGLAVLAFQPRPRRTAEREALEHLAAAVKQTGDPKDR